MSASRRSRSRSGLLAARRGLRSDRGRARRPGARSQRDVRAARRAVRGGRARAGAVHDLDRSAARDGGVPARSRPARSATPCRASRMFQAFAMATPGMRELLSIGKVWELAQLQRRTRGAAPYDLVDRRRARDRSRRRHPADAQDVRRDRSRRADRPQGRTIATTIADRDVHRRDRGLARRRRCRSTRRSPLRERARARGAWASTRWSSTRVYPERFSAEQVADLRRGSASAQRTARAGGAPRGAVASTTRAEHAARASPRGSRAGLGDRSRSSCRSCPPASSARADLETRARHCEPV